MATLAEPEVVLCERCGYVLMGLRAAPDATCPECGLLIETSLDGGRAGSPWQQKPSLAAWRETNLGMLLRPAESARGLQIEGKRSDSLRHLNMIVASMFFSPILLMSVVALWGKSPIEQVEHGGGKFLVAIALALTWFAASIVPVWMLLHLLTTVEAMGIQYFGRRRGWRITPTVATAVCSHATVGWIIAGVLALLGWLLISMMGVANTMAPGGPRPTPWMLGWSAVVFGAPALPGFLIGLLVFEVLVYIGVRQCWYANLPGARARLHDGGETLTSAANAGHMPASTPPATDA